MIFVIVAILAQCSIYNTYVASGSRGFFVLADDNLCPPFLVKISKKRGVPYIGILSLAVVTLILCQADFTTLVSTEVVFILALYIILPLAVIKLRKDIPVEERKKRNLFVMPGGKAGLAYFCGMPIFISIVALLVNGTDYFVTGLIATASGVIVYVIRRLTGIAAHVAHSVAGVIVCVLCDADGTAHVAVGVAGVVVYVIGLTQSTADVAGQVGTVVVHVLGVFVPVDVGIVVAVIGADHR